MRALVARLVGGWESRDAGAIAACLAKDAVWHNMPHPPITGRDAIERAIGRFLAGIDSVVFEILNEGAIGPGLYVNERVDRFRMADGRQIDLPVMGIFEMRDGLVQSWRDYFDAAASP